MGTGLQELVKFERAQTEKRREEKERGLPQRPEGATEVTESWGDG